MWGRPLCLLSRGGAYKNICQRFRPDQTRASRAHATVIAFYGALLKIGNRSRSCLASLMAETTAGRFLLRGQTLGTGSARVPRSIAWIVAGLDGGGRHAPHHTCLRLWGMDGWRRGWEEEGWAEKRTILFFLQNRRHLQCLVRQPCVVFYKVSIVCGRPPFSDEVSGHQVVLYSLLSGQLPSLILNPYHTVMHFKNISG